MNKPVFCDICDELIDPSEDYHLGPIDEFCHAECCPECQENDAADVPWREYVANEHEGAKVQA